MADFFSNLFSEIGARRRRVRAEAGDRGQGLLEFSILGGLSLGSLGLFLNPWMARAAPWGFALPVVFLLGYLYLDLRRQNAMARAGEIPEDREASQTGSDRLALIWSLGCALAGAATFAYAWMAEPPPAPAPSDAADEWRPPADAVDVDLEP
ncbi:MAG: hypothetical protein GC189_07740 [Alphaproteobacteria bacterium]|nr:hypothetical protein [Alphaproteobacteria bacterium]